MRTRLLSGLVIALIVSACVAGTAAAAPVGAPPLPGGPTALEGASGISVTTQPQGQTVAVGQTASFSAAASGDPTPTVQWQVSSDGGFTWSSVPGATSTTCSFTASAGQDGDRYRAVFTNGGGSARSRAATLTAVTTDPSLKALLPSSIVSSNDLRIASDIPYPPWEYFDFADGSSQQVTGSDYDLSLALGAKIGIPTSFNDVPFDTIILNIMAGTNDIIMSGMYDNAPRERVGVSLVDYAYDGTSILVLKGNPKRLRNLDSLAGRRVACERGTVQQTLLEKLNRRFKRPGKARMTILALPNRPAALLAVVSRRAVADLMDHSAAEFIAKTTNHGKVFHVVSDPGAPHGYHPQFVGVGILATNTGLIDAVQQALQGLITDGIYARIIKTYGLLPVASAQVNQGGGQAR